jgi:hypothetical protein
MRMALWLMVLADRAALVRLSATSI